MWTILFLVASCLVIEAIQPFRFVTETKYLPLRKNPAVSKLSNFFGSAECPEVLVMGCSLPMTAIATYDERYARSLRASDENQLRTYTRARYLEYLLQHISGSKRTQEIFNLTCVACMVSDANSLLLKVLETKTPQPKLIIYGVGPRSFVDNTIGQKTHIEQLLDTCKTSSDIADPKMSWSQRGELFISSLWKFYADRSDYRAFITSLFSDIVDRSPTVYAANQRAIAEKAQDTEFLSSSNLQSSSGSKRRVGASKLELDLALYNARYNPPNFTMFEAQKTKFDQFTKLCREKKINLLVVSMPITEQNRKLLDSRLLNAYSTEVRRLSLMNGAAFLDLTDDTTFTIADFEDSVHTNARGGKKVQDRIAAALADQDWL